MIHGPARIQHPVKQTCTQQNNSGVYSFLPNLWTYECARALLWNEEAPTVSQYFARNCARFYESIKVKI
jgi:hypothetical protein